MRPLIALLTDFGTQDHYVGTMKGVMAGICPDATFVDITHEVPPQDVLAGALELAAARGYFPAGTVFLAVVDPGVGSDRKAIAVRAGGRTFVAPDNGLVSLAVGERAMEVVELANPAYALPVVSRTFEGRDRFAPAAAWLARGTDFALFGPPVDGIVRVDLPAVRGSGSGLDGEVVRVDRFGNLVTNVPAEALLGLAALPDLEVSVAGRTIVAIGRTYADLTRGGLGALVGSTGHLEISVNGGNAASILACGRGATVRVARRA